MKISNAAVEQIAVSKAYREESQKVKIEVFSSRSENLPNPEVAIEFTHIDESADIDANSYLSDKDRAKIKMLEEFISALTGKRFKFQDIVKIQNGEKVKTKQLPNNDVSSGSVNSAQNVGFGMRVTTSHELYEAESMNFKSRGVVRTSDGREISFELNVGYSREYYEKTEMRFQFGQVMQDPLVINLDGRGIAFDSDYIKLDLNLDGHEDTFRRLAKGSGFLVIDKNSNGIVDDGSELFGPSTGQGFNELAVYDSDQNGWIDENDEVFNSLKIWQIDSNGESTLIGIKEAGVGAIYLKAVDSAYSIKEGLDPIANIRKSSVYLKEEGKAFSIHEIDLKI